MDYQALGVADVCQVAEQVQRLDEFLCRGKAALYAESKDSLRWVKKYAKLSSSWRFIK
jgi:hypothetical protein